MINSLILGKKEKLGEMVKIFDKKEISGKNGKFRKLEDKGEIMEKGKLWKKGNYGKKENFKEKKNVWKKGEFGDKQKSLENIRKQGNF